MKVTKFTHSCLLVETESRVALFDPGVFASFDPESLPPLDDIFVTHSHGDHMDVDLIRRLREKFPKVRITAPADAKAQLEQAGIETVSTDAPEGVTLFTSPHEAVRPYFDEEPPQEVGYHYLELLSHPGDSHSFSETMPILALPMTAPWGYVVAATKLALELKPKHIIPIHDWHWRDEARAGMYKHLVERFAEAGITFHDAVNDQPFEINL